MKIDHDYLKKILEGFEAAERTTTDLNKLASNGLPHDDENLDNLVFHMEILEDEGMIEAIHSDGIGFGRVSGGGIVISIIPLRLTSSGHKFLANTRQPGVWKTIRSKLGDASIETIVTVAKDLALSAAKDLVS